MRIADNCDALCGFLNGEKTAKRQPDLDMVAQIEVMMRLKTQLKLTEDQDITAFIKGFLTGYATQRRTRQRAGVQ